MLRCWQVRLRVFLLGCCVYFVTSSISLRGVHTAQNSSNNIQHILTYSRQVDSSDELSRRQLGNQAHTLGYLVSKEVRVTFEPDMKRKITYTFANAPYVEPEENLAEGNVANMNADTAAPLEISFCNASISDVHLERLVRTPGTRMVILMLYNNPETYHQARYCRDWIVPVLVRKTKYMESVIYRDIFTAARMEILKRNVDFVFICTYKAWLLSNPAVSASLLESMLLDAKHHKFDATPLDNTHDTHANLLQSLLATHSPAAINCWNVLLINLNFTAAEIQFSTKLSTYWSSMLITPRVLDKLSQVMRQAIDIVENPKLNTLQKYFRTETHVKGADPAVMKQIFGTPNFQMHPFIFERLHVFLLLMMRAKLPIWHVGRMRLPPVSKDFAPFSVHRE